MTSKRSGLWLLWLALSAALAAYLAYALWLGDREVFLIGELTDGHHQLAEACDVCHTSPFGGGEILQDACVNCHGAELKAARDAHPRAKFTDPRNAERVTVLDARYCVACHTEHDLQRTRAMGVTLPDDFCVKCHAEIAEDRPSHGGVAFRDCASAGCHNFHDNRSLYEDFLAAHVGEPATLAQPQVARRDDPAIPRGRRALALGEQDPPDRMAVSHDLLTEWSATAHARSGINCSDCHRADTKAEWTDKTDHTSCQRCHASETEGFLAGKHGMRLEAGLPAMTVAAARQAMNPDNVHRSLTCSSCHGAHGFNTRQAAVESCTACHNDAHTLAYEGSPHHVLWQAEQADRAEAGSGVSCATCHMPREAHGGSGDRKVRVQHNQSANLRPNEKMIRGVCMNCHGLAFAIDALADEELVRNNFRGQPQRHVPSIDWAQDRIKDHEARISEAPQGARQPFTSSIAEEP